MSDWAPWYGMVIKRVLISIFLLGTFTGAVFLAGAYYLVHQV